jgi:5-methylcytosine-specific restriction endonuclease McrA
MNFALLFLSIIILGILSSILVLKNEDKKDKRILDRKNKERENLIYNEFVYLSEKEKRRMEYQEYLNSEHWKEIRLKALERAGNRCQLCSSKINLNVHHNTYKNKGHEDLKDLVVLCKECHAKFHDKFY